MLTLESVTALSLGLMALLVFLNVVLRYFFSSGLPVAEELSRLLFVWVVFLGAILAALERKNIAYLGLLRRLPPLIRTAFVVAGAVLLLVFGGMFLYGGWLQTRINMDNHYPILGLPYALLYLAATVFGLGLIVIVLANAWVAWRQRDPRLLAIAEGEDELAVEMAEEERKALGEE
ncbi:hypothetical protein OA56_00780 [Tepidiphilus sp. HLB4]